MANTIRKIDFKEIDLSKIYKSSSDAINKSNNVRGIESIWSTGDLELSYNPETGVGIVSRDGTGIGFVNIEELKPLDAEGSILPPQDAANVVFDSEKYFENNTDNVNQQVKETNTEVIEQINNAGPVIAAQPLEQIARMSTETANNNSFEDNINSNSPQNTGFVNPFIPESLDQNFGVIEEPKLLDTSTADESLSNNSLTPDVPNTSENALSQNDVKLTDADVSPEIKAILDGKPAKKGFRINIGRILAFIFIIGFGIFCYCAYKLFIGINPPKIVSNIFRTFGNEYNEILSNNAAYKVLTNNEEVLFDGSIKVKSEKKDLSINIDGGVSKKSGMTAVDGLIKDYGNIVASPSFKTVNNSSFIKLTGDNYYRFIKEEMIDANKIVNAIDFKPALDKMADILEEK